MKEGWNTSELKDICSKYGEYGMSVPSKPFDGIRYLRITDITDNGSLNPELVSAEIENIDDSYRLEIGDVLFARTGATVGKTLVYEESMGPCVYAGYLIRYKPDQSIILPRFLYYITHSNKYYQWVNKNQKVAAQPNISAKLYNSYKVSYPSLHEQQQIVDFLDAEFAKIDELKNQAEQSLQNAKDLFQAALKEMLTPKEGWVKKKFSDIYDVRDGTHDSPKYIDSGYPLVTSKNLKGDYIDMVNVKYISEADYLAINERSRVDVGDILFAMIGTIGNATLVENEPNYAIKNMALFKVPSTQSSKFLKYILDSQSVLDEMHTKSKGTTQSFVSLGYLRNFEISIPAKEEQEQIVSQITEFKKKVDILQSNYSRTIQLCADLKQALLRQVFE